MRGDRPLFDPSKLQRWRRGANAARIRGLSEARYLGDGMAICRVLGRFKMFVDTRDLSLSQHLLMDGFWEMWLTEALVSAVKPGMIAIDIGANLGYFSLLMAYLVGSGGQVHAFEPNAPIADRLRHSAELNGFRERLTVHEVPLGAVEGQPVILKIPEGEPKNAHVEAVYGDLLEHAQCLHIRRLDSYSHLLDADVIKIDAEAAEYGIWQGMAGLLDRGRPLTIFLEFTPARYEDPLGFLREMVNRGFGVSVVTTGAGVKGVSLEAIASASATVDQMLLLRR